MGGSSFPVWAIVLVAGWLAAFLMGCFNPFIAKEDKKRAKGSNVKEIELQFHFRGAMYLVISLAFGTTAFVFFILESFSKIKDMFLNGSIASYILTLAGALCVLTFAEIVIIVTGILTENKTVSSITAQYARKYGVEIIAKDI